MRACAVMARHLLLILLCLSGCSKTLYVDGVPNYYRVDVGIRRSGQPTTLKQWQTIWRDLESERPGRPHYVVKLNFDDEGSSDLATQAGFVLLKHPIQPAADKDVFDNLANTFVQPTDAEVDAIERDVAAHADDGELIQCTHGQDRTSYAVGRDRVLRLKWLKINAYAEMVTYGFHGPGGPQPTLHGLHEKWENFKAP